MVLLPHFAEVPLLQAVVCQGLVVVRKLVGDHERGGSQRGKVTHTEVTDESYELALALVPVGTEVPDLVITGRGVAAFGHGTCKRDSFRRQIIV